MIELFSSNDVEAAKKCLWDCCNSAKGQPFHARCDSDRQSQLKANLADLLGAFNILDSSVQSVASPPHCLDFHHFLLILW